jgi:hypothetical protein
MTTTAPLDQRPGPASTAALAIRSIQPDRDHALLEMVGAADAGSIDELRQRLDGLLVAGARYLLVDLTRAGRCDPAVISVLGRAAGRLAARRGWLRVLPNPAWPVHRDVDEATLSELFAIYRAATGSGWG